MTTSDHVSPLLLTAPPTAEPFAWEWVDKIRRREVSATEVARHYLDRITSVNDVVNAVAWIDEDLVLGQARAADEALRDGGTGALLGLPVTVKDNLEVAGLRCTSGTWGRRDHVPSSDATAVSRIRREGALVLAKTNLPELAASYETDNAIVGRTNHPIDPRRTPGGSSGGEAALLAANASPLGIGTDGGGSIRVPSHYCGLFGLRPTVGRVPETGAWPSTRASGYADLTCVGPMGRTTRDVALLLSVVAGADDVDPYAPDVPLRPWDEVAVAGLRVGFYTDDGFAPPTEGTRAAVRRAATLLEEAGAQVEEVAPPGLTEASELFFGATGAMGGHDLMEQLQGAEGHHTEQFATFLSMMQLREPTAADYFQFLERFHGFRARVRTWLRGFDAVLCPVVAGPAPLHGTAPAGYPAERYFQYEAFNYTHAFSVAGAPAMSVPVGEEDGLPVGVQVAAAPWREDVVLAVSAALEQAGATWSPAVAR